MSIVIPKGNWNAVGLSNYLTEQLKDKGVDNEVTYDCGRLAFNFKNAVDIIRPQTAKQVLTYLGFPIPDLDTTSYTNVTTSSQPINLSGPTCIHVNTDLPLFNIPQSGRLATIGVDVNYGELLLYFDESGSQPPLMTAQYIDTITIQLTDEYGDELTCYEHLPWQCVLSIDPVENSGYSSLSQSLSRPNVEQT